MPEVTEKKVIQIGEGDNYVIEMQMDRNDLHFVGLTDFELELIGEWRRLKSGQEVMAKKTSSPVSTSLTLGRYHMWAQLWNQNKEKSFETQKQEKLTMLDLKGQEKQLVKDWRNLQPEHEQHITKP
jgi:hypothetical protein